MKKLLFALLLFPLALAAQQPAKSKTSAATSATSNANVVLTCTIVDCPVDADSLTLFEFAGLGVRPVAKARRQGQGTYYFTLPASKARFYAVGLNTSSVARLVLGEEPEVKLWANANFMDRGRTLGSKANANYEYVVRRSKSLQEWPARNAELGRMKTAFLDSIKVADPFLWHAATLLVTPHFEGPLGASEAEFYGNNWFRNAALAKDRSYDEFPEVYTSFVNYTKTMVSLGAKEEQIKGWVSAQLAKLPANSKTRRMALGGVITGCQEAQQGPLLVHFAQQYLKDYKGTFYGEDQRLEYEISRASTSTPGMQAPNLAGMTPDSSTYSLSQMRGKVVLVDFWASWCGPCRRENPNVKALYEKYKDKGFEILGVSLDSNRDAWLKAIATDGLTWKHISDLRGWQSGHAELYSVSSIPQTVLLDRDGKIIQRNLRGEGLSAKLKEVFGE